MKLDISSTAIEKGIDIAKEFLQKLIGPSIDEIGLLFADNVRYWRLKNQLRILQRAEEHIKAKNIKTKKISLKVLTPLLEGAGLEEDELLQEKWSNLLVNYVDSRKTLRSTVFPYILSQLSSVEALALEYCGSNSKVTLEEFTQKLKIFDAEISNLIRLGLIREILIVPGVGEALYGQRIYLNEFADYHCTELGLTFLEACKPPK